MKRRIISLLLAFCLCLSLVPVAAPRVQAADFDTTGWVWPVKAVNAPEGASNKDLYCKTMYRAYYSDHLAIDITDYTGYNYVVRAAKSGTVAIVYAGCGNYSGARDGGSSCSSATCYPTKNGAYHANTHTYAGKTFCNWGFGNGVTINHDNGVDSSEYAHMSSVTVSPGQYVQAGQIIGYMGSAGASTGKHLHFTIKHNGSPVNNNPIGDDVIIYNSSLWNGIDTIDYADEPDEGAPAGALDIGDDFYANITYSGNKNQFLSTGADSNVVMKAGTGYGDQIWFFDRQANGSYLIRSAYNGKVLDVYDGSPSTGANIQTYPYNGTPAQQWYILGSQGNYQFRAACTTCVMDGAVGMYTDSTNVATYSAQENSYSQYFDVQVLTDLSPKAQISSDRSVYPLGAQVDLSWPYVLCTDWFWIDIWRGPDHLVSENLGHGTNYSFIPTEPGTYGVYITSTMVNVGYLSDVYNFTVTESGDIFTDVFDTDWYYDSVVWAVKNKITSGTGGTNFSPNDVCTRAQVVTFLYRAAGSPVVSGTNPFSDVASGDYFYNAVLWAVQNGITVGTSNTAFSPEEPCTRAQVATFLWRYMGKSLPDSLVSPFVDISAEEYYYFPVLWAYYEGITKGDGAADTFNPDGKCTRAQIVTFLYRAAN